ncbi:[FeFe] hydrogenase H-cluster radical SAM maturase HydE [Candidatus Falkowbacteria bacterium]|jgi:biotin synthase|nr:[FeFe] hydrogenase H-cluster radical SAM maturase HydE [Candidatus Falkowbacteria bacterium]MBT7007160.1 [FeFe] hydrogenase H-cluster radical SAM maturase HydE [Candidatus Falkowbacteria bacterium]
MCLTIPGRVIEKKNNLAIVQNYNNEKKEINLALLPEIEIGDWILHTVGNVVRKIEKDEAKQIIELLESQEITDISKSSTDFQNIIKKVQTETLNKQEIIYLLNCRDEESKILRSEANVIRQENLKDFFCIHGIIEFSNHCNNNCLYCGLRRDNTELKRFRMTPDEIIKTALESIKEKGYKLLVLQSGEDTFYSKEDLVKIIKKIKEKEQVFIFISIGERDYQTYKELKEAGANGVLFRFESTNRDHYNYLHPNQSYDKRFEHLKWFQELGYFIATGSIIGLPGQISDDIADDILFFTKNKFPMASFGPFVPSQNTPLEKSEAGNTDLMLNVIATLRLLNKYAKIPVVTAHETLDPTNGRKKALQSGANSLMFNLTPDKYRDSYRLYDDKYFKEEKIWEKYGLFNEPDSYEMLEKKLKENL